MPVRLLLPALLLLAGCATPLPPSGGPTDEIPPALAATLPEEGATDVSARSIRLTFSEYVDAASFTRAFSIAPAIDGPLDYDWDGRSLEIDFPEPLRENTTYVLTLDTNLRDAHGVSLAEPITFAFSTGPTINRGRLDGRLVDPRTGAGLAGVDVYAYAAPDSTPPLPLPERPDYRTQTGEGGAFTFTYLREQPYYVVGLRDLNRNRRPDPVEPFAVPPRPLLVADTVAVENPGAWYVTRLDSVAPVPEGARALSERRLAVRFSEPVRPATLSPAAWSLRDSTSGTPAAIHTVYRRPGEPRDVFLLTDVLVPRTYEITPGGVVDTSGNPVQQSRVFVRPPAAADTVGLRFEGFLPDTLAAGADADSLLVLPPRSAPGVRFNQPLDSLRLRQVVSVQDSTGAALPYGATTPDNVSYFLLPRPDPAPGGAIRIAVDGSALGTPDTTYVRRFRYMPRSAVGELSGTVAASDTSAAIVVEVYPAGAADRPPLRTAAAGPDGRFLFRDLPAGTYRLRAYLDRDADARWDGGQTSPYAPAEPLAWSTAEHRVRARWETALPDTLRILDF